MYYNKINKCQALVKRIYTLAVCLFGFSLSAVGQINPTFSATDFRGDFIMIGNVNHELEGGYNGNTPNIETIKDLVAINNAKTSDAIFNSNSAEYHIEATINPCPNVTDQIIYANLSWCGKADDQMIKNESWKNVLFKKFDEDDYTPITAQDFFIVNSGTSNDENGIYVCHADITNLWKDWILKTGTYKASCANIQTITQGFGSNSTKFSGWTLTIIYEQSEKLSTNISHYRPNNFQASAGDGNNNDVIFENLKLGYNYNGVGDVSIGTSIAGGTREANGDNFFVGPQTIIQDIAKRSGKYSNVLNRLNAPQNLGRREGDIHIMDNYLNNTINDYSGIPNATASNEIKRGYDIDVVRKPNIIGKDTVFLGRGNSTISYVLEGPIEHHLITDFIIQTGHPETPQIETIMPKPEISSDSCLNYVIRVKTKQNVEDLDNFVLNINLPKYTTNINGFKVDSTPLNTDSLYLNEKKLNAEISDKELATEIGVPSSNQKITINYRGRIPKTLVDTTILKISYQVCVDKEKYAQERGLTGTSSKITSQAETSTVGAESRESSIHYSNPYSVLEEKNKCDIFGGFGGGGGDGFGGGGGDGGGGDADCRNGQPTSIELDFDFGCSDIPDTISIDGCEGECFPVENIKEILYKEHNFNIDSLARLDSLAWIEVKRDSIIELCQMQLSGGKQLESIDNTAYSDSSNWYLMKDYWINKRTLELNDDDSTKLFDFFKNCRKKHPIPNSRIEMILSEIRNIINRKVEVTHLDYSLVIDNWEIDNGNGGKDTCIPFIEDEAMYSVIFATPYKNKDSKSLCNDTLIIRAHKEVVPLIELLDGDTSINNNGKIQYCKEETPGLLTIKRGKRNYEVEVIDDKFSAFTLVSDSTYIFKPNIDTKKPGKDSVKFIQKNNTGCISDTFTLNIEVLDVTASETPALPSAINRCVTPNEKVIITIEDLEAVKEKRAEGFDVRWFAVINNKEIMIKEDTISIEVPIDSVGTFTYGAKFYFFGCESKMAKTILNIRPEGEKIKNAIISGCQYSTPEENRIKKALGINKIDSLYYFRYDATNPSQTFEETDSIGFNQVINNINFNQHGKNYFYVRQKNEYGCWSDTTLMTIDIKQTDSIRTQFKNMVDSVLYCVGDDVKTIDEYIEKSNHLDPSFEWRWYNKEPKMPYNVFPTNNITNGTTITINSSRPSTNDYYVVRIDSNGCASNPAKFRVQVDDKITDLPMVGDTSNLNFNNLITLDFCKGVSEYTKNVLPMKSTIDNYTIEWIEKTNITENSDSLLTQTATPPSLKNNKKDVILVNVNSVKKYYYSVRQSTQMGCKGPWANVILTTNDSVREIPQATPIIACQFDDTLLEVRNSIDKSFSGDLILNYYDSQKNLIEEKEAIVPTDVAGSFLQSNKQNKFYVSLTNRSTSCEGKIIGIDATINPKPGLPLIADENKNQFFCTDNKLVTINDFAKVAINTAENNTKLLWSNETILTNTDQYTNVFVRQIDTTTQCLGDTININITIEKTFEYSPTDSIIVCHNESVNLWNIIEKNIRTKNQLIKNAKTEFSISPIIGNIQQAKLSQIEAENIVSTAISTEDQIKDYIIKIWEPISGCEVYDSMCIRFKALPKLEESTPGSFCQYELFDLPTPSSDYNFEWKIVDGESVNVWNDISLTQDETFRLTATTKDSYQCKDSIDWNVKIIEIPDTPTALDTTYCQFTGKHTIETQLQGTTNNPVSDLSYIWYKNGVVTDKVNTDTLFSGKSIQETYTVVVTNQFTRCSNRDSVIVNIWQAITLNMEDIEPVCEPETINVANKVNIYTSTNIASFGGNTPKLLSYFILENGLEKEVTPNDLSAIDFDSNHFERYFGYKMTDSRGVCTSADTFKVTIHPKPSVPTIEGGQDTLFFCKDDAPLTLSAMPNGRLTDIGLFWDNGAKGNTTPVKEDIRCATYNVQAIDTVTQCKGDFIGIVAAIAPAIQTKPIFKNDTIELCAGEILNLWDLAYNSFNHDGFYNSELIITQSTKNGNAIGQNLLEQITSTQQDTSTYWFEITDPLTSCSATNTVVVVFHAKPTIVFDGETTICQYSDLKLNTTGDERLINYKWEIDNNLVSTSDMYQQTNLQDGFEIKLTTTLDELKSCSSTINQKIIVNPAPETLTPITFNRCQTESEKIVKINRNRSSNEIDQYAITWFNTDGTIHLQDEEIEVDLAQSRILEYDVMLTDRITSCNSEKSRVTIKINPRIRFEWSDPDTICPPDEYQLLQNVLNSVTGGTNPKYLYTVFNGDTIDNENNIAQSGRYTVYFTDDNQCENSQEVNVQFFKRPEVPTLIAQNIVCQGIGDITFSAKKNGEDVLNQTFEWKEGVKTTLADQLNVSTDEYGIRNFIITAVDTLSHCRSEELTFKLDIREKIHFSPIEPLESCFDVPVDLTLATQNAYSGNDEEKILSYFSVNSNNSLSLINDPTNVLNSGKVVIKAEESESGCNREDTIIVDIKLPLQISTIGTTTICEGEEINDLTAINAERYNWVRQNGTEVESTLFPFGNSLTETETFRLYGEKKVGNIYCMDSTDVEITVNPNPLPLKDSVLYFCQTTNGVEELQFSTNERNGELLEITWLNSDGDILFGVNQEQIITTTSDTTYTIYAKQINKETSCESKLTKVEVNILPKIEVPTIDSTTCQPNFINLSTLASRGVTAKEYSSKISIESIGITNEIDRSLVTPISNSTEITESGIYRVSYSYTHENVTCRNSADAKLTFLTQPEKPLIDNQAICQNSGEYELKGTPSLSNLRLIWEDLSVYPSRIDTNKTTITTNMATEMNFKVRHIQNNSGCVSTDTIIKVSILPEIVALDLDTSICYGENVNLRKFVESNHQQNKLINSILFRNLEMEQYNEEEIDKTSRFYAFFSDKHGVCRDTSMIQIQVNNPIEIEIDGYKPTICSDETIQLSVSGADEYKWNNVYDGANFEYKKSNPGEFTIELNAKKSFNDIFCYKDSTFTIEVLADVKPLTLTYDTCRNSRITTEIIKEKFNISETIDSIWYNSQNIIRSNLSRVIEDEGDYLLLVSNQYGCKATHQMKVNMYGVDNLSVDYNNSTPYCFGSMDTFTAKTDNECKYFWINRDKNGQADGTKYIDTMVTNTNYMLIAAEKIMGCRDTIEFTTNVREQTPIKVNVISDNGKTDICKGDTVRLAVTELNSVFWSYNDIVINSNDLVIVGETNTNINVWGIDINNCQTKTDTVEINIATLIEPIIETENPIGEYDLSRDNMSIKLNETKNSYFNPSGLTYYWQIGNGEIDSISHGSLTHTFSNEEILFNKDIEVKLKIVHEYGCEATATKILTIDPSIEVPNTLLYGHEFIFMEDYELQIFDRVGTLIHEGKGWDGTYKGRPAIADTYFYSLLYYVKGEKQFKTGYITLVR